MKKGKVLTLVVFFSICSFALGYFLKTGQTPKQEEKQTNSQKIPSEIKEIKSSLNLDQKVKIYKKLIERVGPEQAQEDLLHSGLPFDGQTHLLNHTVGDYLYEKYKLGGLIFCRDYFLSSCYHGFVIRALADGGSNSLTKVMNTCWRKGERVAIQCAHAIGHGFLAYDGYKNFIKSLEDCDNLGTKSKNFPNFNCYDGAFMENVFAVHDDGKPSPDRWLNKDDPLYPCDETKIPQKYIRACWSNQPSWMYQLFQGNLPKVADECSKLAPGENQTTCFDALARQIHPLTNGSVQESFRLCSIMPLPWIDPCLTSISKAFFSVGDRQAPFEICSSIHPESKDNCYHELSTIIALYSKDQKERDQSCSKIRDQDWVDKCLNTKLPST